ncbi:MAG: hypothetical protein WBF73_07865 [Bradyrhizobium sp.]|jgi:hypothetical protein
MSKFEFMINLKIPQFLGLAVPNAVRPHRRIHRIAALFAAARIDAVGTKLPNVNVRRMVASGGKPNALRTAQFG